MLDGISTTNDVDGASKDAAPPSVPLCIKVTKTGVLPIKQGDEANLWVGNVCSGTDHETVALKQMRLKLLNDPSLFDIVVDVLRHHAKIGQCLKHPNVVRLYGLGYDTSHRSVRMPLLVLPLSSYGNITDYLRSHPDLTDQDKVRLAKHMLSGLVYLHKLGTEGLPHGNIHPGNVLVDAEGIAKLADVGLDTALCSLADYTGIHRNCWYMPPERLIPKDDEALAPPSASADVWAMAFVIAQMWTLERPFAHLTSYKFLLMLKGGEMAAIDRPTQVPMKVWAVIQDCFKFGEDEGQRPSAKQLLGGLTMLLAEEDLAQLSA